MQDTFEKHENPAFSSRLCPVINFSQKFKNNSNTLTAMESFYFQNLPVVGILALLQR